jgi:beta-lactamase class A
VGAVGEDLTGALDEIVARFSGRVGYSIKNRTTGALAVRNEDEPFPTASTIKLPILTAFHDYVRSGAAGWDDTVPISRVKAVGGSGVLRYFSREVELTYRDIAWLMICLSDNVATNLILDAMGIDRTNDLIAALIGPDIRVRGRSDYRPGESSPSMGESTPKALGRYLDLLADGVLPGAGETIAVARQQVFNSAIPRYLSRSEAAPGLLQIAHKTGALPGVRADIAVIDTPAVQLSMVIMTADSHDTGFDFINEGEACIGEISRAVCDRWLGG